MEVNLMLNYIYSCIISFGGEIPILIAGAKPKK